MKNDLQELNRLVLKSLKRIEKRHGPEPDTDFAEGERTALRAVQDWIVTGGSDNTVGNLWGE